MSYSPTLGRFLETDPEQYVDGPNMYQMETSNPVDQLDPTGTDATTQPATTQLANGITSLPGNTWSLFGPNGNVTQNFTDNYISAHNWGWSGLGSTDMPPAGSHVQINTRHDTLQIGNRDNLTEEQTDRINDLIDDFNQVSGEHETQMANRLDDIYNGPSTESGREDWNRRRRDADNLSTTSELERNDMYRQLSLLQQILEAAGMPVPNKLRNDLKSYAPKQAKPGCGQS